ncbi:MAG: hypothetical protein J6Y29_02630 [Clostridiales bacterium]|nr:hypothetical protein [Clostridiales bacterium]
MGSKVDTVKRVFAWVLLLGFVALLVNIFVLHFYLKESFTIYLLIAGAFIFIKKKTSF